MDIKFNFQLCPYCFGTGEQKAMQSAMTNEGRSIRVNDKVVKCKHCDGTGVRN